jgi:glycosyltransferase involved in cell wall biosynthesis
VGPMTDAVREIETKYRSAGWLDIRRNVSAKQLSSLYSRSLALLLPSQYEAMPYAVLEAQAAGTPVIVSNTVSEELVADRITGFRVSVHDPRVYGEKLRMLVEGETWGGMSMCARKHAEEFDAVKIAGRYIELISRFRDPTLPQELR